jgi:uncharacterized protein (DUF305 family)
MIRKSIAAMAVTLSLGLAAGTGLAQQPTKQPVAKQPVQQATGAHEQAAMNDYKAAMEKMHQAMMAANDADPDRAFALKMIEHHRGGIAMSEIVVKHGDDTEAKRMAQKTMDMQKKEVAELESWLERHGGKTPKP